MARTFVLARQPMGRQYFRILTPLGPACTTKLREAAKFPSKEAAMASPAVTSPKWTDWIFAAVEVGR